MPVPATKAERHRGDTRCPQQKERAMTTLPVLSPPEPTELLTASPLPQLRRLVVTVSEGEVIITGRVPSYYFKQLAQEAIRPAVGDRRLLNRVEVCRAS